MYFPQDEIGLDQFGSTKQNSDFHLDTPAWEFPNSRDMSHGLFRVKHIFLSVFTTLFENRNNSQRRASAADEIKTNIICEILTCMLIFAGFHNMYTLAPTAIVSEMPCPILYSTYKQICFISFCDTRLMAHNTSLSLPFQCVCLFPSQCVHRKQFNFSTAACPWETCINYVTCVNIPLFSVS